jgi:hypothetical protein
MRTVLVTAVIALFVPALAFAQDVCAPAKVANLAVATGRTTIVVTWTAPGDDCNDGTATAYDLRYSTSPITEGNFDSATSVSTSSPQVAGSSECVGLTSQASCTTFYFALKTRDENNFWSPLSNLPSGQTRCTGSLGVACP